MWLKNFFHNPDRIQRPKRDWLKWFARRHYYLVLSFWIKLDLVVLLTIGFNFKKIALSIPLLILCVPLGILTVISFINASTNTVLVGLVKKHNNEVLKTKARVTAREGAPGTGKTSSNIYDSKILADNAYRKLCFEYFLYLGLKDEKLSDFEKDKKHDVIEAFEFYQNNNTIPCLWSNIPLIDEYGRKSNKLTASHLLQEEKLPIYNVSVSDEIGIEFEAQKGSSKELEPVSRTARFIRHFYDGYWNFTEQSFSKAFIDIRRVTEQVVTLEGQTWILKPMFLCSILTLIENHYIKKVLKLFYYKPNSKTYNKINKKIIISSKLNSKWIKRLKRYISCIGFRKYVSKQSEYSEDDGKKSRSKSTFYVPSCLNIRYNDRCFRALYKAKDKELKPSKFKSIVLTEEDVEKFFKRKQ